MGRKGAGQKIERRKKVAFRYAFLFFICLLCPACAQSTSTGGGQETPAAETKAPSGSGTEGPSVAGTEAPPAVASDAPPAAETEVPSDSETEVPSVSETEPPAPKSEEPAIEATEAPAAETREPPTDSDAELREVLEYNGIPVRVYKMEKESSKEGYASRAEFEFEFEGIPYELYGFDRNNEERVTKNIKELIGSMCKQREENPESVLADVFGNEKYRVRIRFTNIVYGHWHYYVETEKGMECVAERTGRICDALEAYSVDIDNDGRKELICNCSGSSAWVRVYRENNGVIESGGVDESGYYEEKLGLDSMMGSSSFQERYDPEQGVFVTDGHDKEDGSPKTVTFWGLEPFKFYEFSHWD